MTTTDDRLAALAARRRPAAASGAGTSETPTRHRKPASGARYLVGGLSAAGVLAGAAALGVHDLRAASAGASPTVTTQPPQPVQIVVIHRIADPSGAGSLDVPVTTPAAPAVAVPAPAPPAAPAVTASHGS